MKVPGDGKTMVRPPLPPRGRWGGVECAALSLSKEELSAVKNHASRHHCHGQKAQHLLYIPWLSTYLPVTLARCRPRPVKIAQSVTSKRIFAPVVHAIIDLPGLASRKLLEIIVPREIIMALTDYELTVLLVIRRYLDDKFTLLSIRPEMKGTLEIQKKIFPRN